MSMRDFTRGGALILMLLACGRQSRNKEKNMSPTVRDMPAQFIQDVETREREVLQEYRSAMRKDPSTGRELLEWIDSQIAATNFRDDAQSASAAKKYGATLGQVLVRDYGGTWVGVVDPTGQEWPGVKLRVNVVFVFTRVAKRITGQSDVGLVGTLDAAVKLEAGGDGQGAGTRPWSPDKGH